jgi:Helix-turn-helix domain
MSGPKNDGAAYRAWERRIRDLDSKTLPSGYEKMTLYAIAVAIASYGHNGKECYPAAATVAEVLGCNHKTARKYRKLLVDLGWFERVTGTGRDWEVSISTPKPCQCFGCTRGEKCIFAAA